MPDLQTGLVLQKEKAPAIVRSGGRGGQPHEWEKIIGPTISADPGEDFIIYLYPDHPPANGQSYTEEELEQGKRQAAARSASIANRYWHHVPGEHVETSVRMRPDGMYGVYATHHGAMTEENRLKLAKRRAPRGPRQTSAQDEPGADETNVPAPSTTPEPSVTTGAAVPTAAERAKAAAKKSQGARH